jgi:hypothetical protein
MAAREVHSDRPTTFERCEGSSVSSSLCPLPIEDGAAHRRGSGEYRDEQNS